MIKHSTYLKVELLCIKDIDLIHFGFGTKQYKKGEKYFAIINNKGIAFMIGTNENNETSKEYHAEYYTKSCAVDINEYFQIISTEQRSCVEYE
jgi:hypothetical protein